MARRFHQIVQVVGDGRSLEGNGKTGGAMTRDVNDFAPGFYLVLSRKRLAIAGFGPGVRYIGPLPSPEVVQLIETSAACWGLIEAAHEEERGAANARSGSRETAPPRTLGRRLGTARRRSKHAPSPGRLNGFTDAGPGTAPRAMAGDNWETDGGA